MIITLTKRRAAAVGLLVCALAATALSALTPPTDTTHRPTPAQNIPQHQVGTARMSKKTIVNMGDLAAAAGGGASDGPAFGEKSVPAARVRSESKPARVAVAAQTAAAGAAPIVANSFDGIGRATELMSPPDPNAAAGLTQIVEVVNVHMAGHTRGGAPDICGSTQVSGTYRA